MASSVTGKAWWLVEKFLDFTKAFVEKLPQDQASQIQAVAKDDMFFLAHKIYMETGSTTNKCSREAIMSFSQITLDNVQ
jgi:hypothetical protein